MTAIGSLGVPPALRLRGVFLVASAFAAGVLGVLARSFDDAAPPAAASKAAAPAGGAAVTAGPNGFPAQPALRAAALVVGWSLTLSVVRPSGIDSCWS